MKDLEILKEIEVAGEQKLSEWKKGEDIEYKNLSYIMDGEKVISLNLGGMTFFEEDEEEPDDGEEYPKIPNSFFQLEGLESLFLSDVFFKIPPAELGAFKNLKILNLGHSSISKLPKSLGDLKKLEILYLSENQITELPPELGQLKNLKELSLMENQLTCLPRELFEITGITYASFLYNKLESIPPEIVNWKELRTLWLSNNLLKELPDELSELQNLEFLDFYSDSIKNFPQCLLKLPLPFRLRNSYWELRGVELQFCKEFEDLPSQVILRGKKAISAHFSKKGKILENKTRVNNKDFALSDMIGKEVYTGTISILSAIADNADFDNLGAFLAGVLQCAITRAYERENPDELSEFFIEASQDYDIKENLFPLIQRLFSDAKVEYPKDPKGKEDDLWIATSRAYSNWYLEKE